MSINNELNRSLKWSAVTELVCKLIAPIINAILSRILLPEEFAPLANINIVITFGEIFIESGFKKYLLQRNYKDEDEYREIFDTAFSLNLLLALSIWMIICFISKPLSFFLGGEDISFAIAISGVLIPLYSMSGMLNSRFQRMLEFDKLFMMRLITAIVPCFVTVPLAYSGCGYWSLVIGNISSVFVQVFVLTLTSKYRFRFVIKLSILKNMLSFGVWTITDNFAIWLTSWVDSIIIAHYMEPYFLGLYKNCLSTVNSLCSIVTAAVFPVLFVGLTKYKEDEKKFSDYFTQMQRNLTLLLLPLGVGCFLYRDFAVDIIFGDKWSEAANIFGIMMITSALRTIFVSICSDAYRAKKKLQIPLIMQIIDIIIIVPTCMVAAKYGFWVLVFVRAIIKLDLIIPEMWALKKMLKVDIVMQAKKLSPIFFSTIVMTFVCLFLKSFGESYLWNTISIFIAICVYFCIILLIPSSRNDLITLLSNNKE